MKDNYELFHKILYEFNETGILKNVILIGSWVLPIYKYYFKDSPEIPILRTSDVDFLIPDPSDIDNEINIPEILGKFDFIEQFSLMGNHSKFVHPDLEVEFLIPEIGREKDNSVIISEYCVTAQPLRYLYFIQDHSLEIVYKEINIVVPEPAAFVLLKFLLTIKRKDKAKIAKDLSTALELSDFLLKLPDQVSNLRTFFTEMPKSWQRKLLNIIDDNSIELFDIISEL